MKQRITTNDLKSLSEDQRRSLTEMWTPALYDVAVAKVLKNVATDDYDEYEFVVGGISIHGVYIYLSDIAAANTSSNPGPEEIVEEIKKGLPQTEDPLISIKVDSVFGESYPGFGGREDFDRAANGMNTAIGDMSDENEEAQDEEYDEEYQEEEFEEEDLEDNYQLPAVHIKDDCTPLLTIGNMIDILQKNNYGKFDFFLSTSTYDIGCELGKNDSSWGNYSDWEPAELCDVLWESVKELL
jgi:hypothetical protein